MDKQTLFTRLADIYSRAYGSTIQSALIDIAELEGIYSQVSLEQKVVIKKVFWEFEQLHADDA